MQPRTDLAYIQSSTVEGEEPGSPEDEFGTLDPLLRSAVGGNACPRFYGMIRG